MPTEGPTFLLARIPHLCFLQIVKHLQTEGARQRSVSTNCTTGVGHASVSVILVDISVPALRTGHVTSAAIMSLLSLLCSSDNLA